MGGRKKLDSLRGLITLLFELNFARLRIALPRAFLFNYVVNGFALFFGLRLGLGLLLALQAFKTDECKFDKVHESKARCKS